MNDATLMHFRSIAAAMQTEPSDWQWIGPHMSQRMFGITEARAKAYAARHGGKATPEGRTVDLGNNEQRSIGVFPSDGGFVALTLSESKSGFKTRKGAESWLARRGYGPNGERLV